jgi:hypothetical protein
MESVMLKTFGALAIAATVAVAAVAVPKPAEAKCWGCAVGVGVAAGALITSAAIANSRPYYPAYAAAPVYAHGTCFYKKQKFFDGWTWRVRVVPVCY